MSRARYMQENRKVRFTEAMEGWTQGRLTQAEAALLLGQSERSFRRHIEHYQTVIRANSRLSSKRNGALHWRPG